MRHRLHNAAKADVAGQLVRGKPSPHPDNIRNPVLPPPPTDVFFSVTGVTGRNANQLTSPQLVGGGGVSGPSNRGNDVRPDPTMVGIGYLPRLINLYTHPNVSQINNQQTIFGDPGDWTAIWFRDDESPTHAYLWNMWNTAGYGQSWQPTLRWTYLVHSLPNVSDDVSNPFTNASSTSLINDMLGSAAGIFKNPGAQPGYGFDIRPAMENFTIPFRAFELDHIFKPAGYGEDDPESDNSFITDFFATLDRSKTPMLRLDFADLNGTPPSGFGKNSSARQYFHFVINDIIRDGFGYNPDGTPKNDPFINDGFDTLNDAIDELQTSESPQFEAIRGLFATEMGGLTTSINFQECREEVAPSGFNNLFFQEFYHFDLEAFGCRTGDLITDAKFHIPVAEHCRQRMGNLWANFHTHGSVLFPQGPLPPKGDEIVDAIGQYSLQPNPSCFNDLYSTFEVVGMSADYGNLTTFGTAGYTTGNPASGSFTAWGSYFGTGTPDTKTDGSGADIKSVFTIRGRKKKGEVISVNITNMVQDALDNDADGILRFVLRPKGSTYHANTGISMTNLINEDPETALPILFPINGITADANAMGLLFVKRLHTDFGDFTAAEQEMLPTISVTGYHNPS